MVAESLLGTLDTMAELDLVHAQARLSIDYRMSAPHFNQEGRLVLRDARHPLLEALFRGDPADRRRRREPVDLPPLRPRRSRARPPSRCRRRRISRGLPSRRRTGVAPSRRAHGP